MKRTFYLVVIFVYFLKTKSQVLNNAPKADRDELKFLVFLQSHYSYRNTNDQQKGYVKRGAGTIIKLNWVLTAAHVVEDYNKTVDGVTTQYSLVRVKLIAGNKNITSVDGKQQIMVHRGDVYVHPNYPKAKPHDDIALINLKDRLQESATVEPAKLLTSEMEVVLGVDCVVCGWGRSHTATKTREDGSKVYDGRKEVKIYAKNLPDHARKGIVQLIKQQNKCNKIFPFFDSEKHFCYGCDYGKKCQQTAKGDSGSPVVCALHKHSIESEYVFAVHNYGCDVLNKKCTSEGPSFGTNVATKEIEDWMNQRMETDVIEMNSYAIAAATIVGAVFVYIL